MSGSGSVWVALVGFAWLPAAAATAPSPAGLVPRVALAKPASIDRPPQPSRLTLKFEDALRVRASAAGLVSEAGADLATVESIAARHGLTFSPLVETAPETLARLVARAAARSGRAQPDLAGMHVVRGPEALLEAAARDLLALPAVEWVHFEELAPPPPCTDIAPETPSYVAQGLQGYRDPALGGLDVPHAWGFGARGLGVTIADCEYGHIAGTEDLCGVIDEPGQTVHPSVVSLGWDNHGTAVLGEMVGLDNAYGVTGVVPEATALFFPELTVEQGSRRVTAITNAIAAVEAGDVVVLEMQTTINGQNDYGPAELAPAVWTVVRLGTDSGVIVVGAAGNGNQNLDSAFYANYRSWGDSGAILVGAGTGNTAHQKLSFSTHGSRVNLQGWGEDVFTLGYGDYVALAGDARQRYTDGFAGTSSATPIVASAVAAVQSFALAVHGCSLEPEAMRQLLTDTGIPQGGPGGHIGPFPDLAAAFGAVLAGPGDCSYGCGNGAREGPEACDGADTGFCPGVCAADCTCLPFGPGAAHDLRVTGYVQAADRLSIEWSPACLAVDHSLVYGPLAAVASYGYTAQVCGLGTGGDWGPFQLGPGSWFFLVVGRDGAGVEGSYGTASDGSERPEHAGDPDCDPVQNLAQPCGGPAAPTP